MSAEHKPHSTHAEKIHEACRYLCGFDVAGWEGHMRNDEVAGVISDAVAGLVEQLETYKVWLKCASDERDGFKEQLEAARAETETYYHDFIGAKDRAERAEEQLQSAETQRRSEGCRMSAERSTPTERMERCPGCLGSGHWETECCDGSGGCSCGGGRIQMGVCNVCHGRGEIGPDANRMANVEAITGYCFIGSGPSHGYWADKPSMGLR